MKPIRKDAEGKTAGQRDREAREKIQREERRIVGVILALVVIGAAGVASMHWYAGHALTC